MNYPQIKPTLNLDFSNTKTLDPRINFRRGTPGAYYDGKTYAKAEENLLSYSEDFSDAYWNKTRINTPTSGQSSPDGQSTAYLLTQTDNGDAGAVYINGFSASIGSKYTLSVYAKAGTAGFLVMAEGFSVNEGISDKVFSYFDLSSGEVSLSHENHVTNIQSVGNQWYRCSITFTVIRSGVLGPLFYLSDTIGLVSSNDAAHIPVSAGSTIYLWGAQLEQRDSVTAYTSTMREDGTSTPITKYQPQLMFASPDQPRFDHGVLTGESKGLLIEESRTNLVTYSEDFSQWDRLFNVTVTSNTVVAPDGTLTGDLIIPSTSASEVFVGQESFGHPSSLYSTTFYVKYAGIQWIGLLEASGFGFVYFDILNGVVGDNRHDGIGTITSIGNGWFRCSIFRNTATTTRYVRIFLCDANGSNYCTASDTKGIYAWGAQLEEGSFPTSCIKTSGASATRSADNASITGENFSSWYRQDEGSFEVDFKSNLPINKWVYIFSLTQNGDYTVNNLALRHPINEETVACRFLVNGSAQFEAGKIDQSYDHLGFSKAVIAYNNQDISVGTKSEFLTQATSIGPNNLNQINLFDINSTSGSNYSNCGHIKKLSYYPQRLTNEQLQQLTK